MKSSDESLLAHRPFMQFWSARLATAAGNQMMMVAVGWQMYDLTGSAWDLGLVGLLQFMPALVLTLVAGHLADHHNRGRILATCMGLQALLGVLLVPASLQHWITRESLLMLALALGTIKAFQMPASQSLTPLLVPPAMLPRALAFASAGTQGSIIVGPALGGFIYVAGPQAVYGVCALLFALGCGLLLRLRHEHAPVPREPITLATVFAGIHFIRQRQVVLGAISLDLFAVLLGGATALLPMFARDVLHVGPWGLGLLRGAPAIGALGMSVLLTHRPFTRRVGRVMFTAVAVYGMATLVFALSESLLLSLVALAVSGAADMVSVVIRQSLVQIDTPDAMRGRVSAVNSIFIGASNQLGEFESGAVAAVLGPVGSVLVGGVGTLLVAGLWMRMFPLLRQRERLTSDPQAEVGTRPA
jgi:MFS family permease